MEILLPLHDKRGEKISIHIVSNVILHLFRKGIEIGEFFFYRKMSDTYLLQQEANFFYFKYFFFKKVI